VRHRIIRCEHSQFFSAFDYSQLLQQIHDKSHKSSLIIVAVARGAAE